MSPRWNWPVIVFFLVLCGAAAMSRLDSSRATTGWALDCAEKPTASAWTDAEVEAPPFPAVEAALYWSVENDDTAEGWARAEGGGKVAVYVALPHGVWVWAGWRVGEGRATTSHHEWCP